MRPPVTRRTALGLYALIFLETVVWVALVPLAPTYARALDLSKLETGAMLAAASFATLVVAVAVCAPRGCSAQPRLSSK